MEGDIVERTEDHSGEAPRRRPVRPLGMALLLVLTLVILGAGIGAVGDSTHDPALEDLEARLKALVPSPDYPDDRFALVTLQEALEALKGGTGGGIGACLVDERTQVVVETGRNRQFDPCFRSDMHAEMDLLNRYEGRVKAKGGRDSGCDPRRKDGLVLYSSLEPCPMCLTRIINAGIRKLYYVAPDPVGGMVHRLEDLPPFWREQARGRDFAPARCSPALREFATELFRFSMRNYGPLGPAEE